MLNIVDEFTHECLAIRIDRKLKSVQVVDVLSDLFILHGLHEHVRSDNGAEFIAKTVQEWITAVGAKTAYIAPGSPWENSFIESLNARLRDELLDGEIFYSTRSPRPRSSSKAGDVITMPFAHTDRWATNRQHRRFSSPQWPRGRLRNSDLLRRPRWHPGRRCTNIQPGPVRGG